MQEFGAQYKFYVFSFFQDELYIWGQNIHASTCITISVVLNSKIVF